MERVILEIVHPYSAVHQRVVVSSSHVLIGRGYHCDVILDDPYVSEEHVEVAVAEDGYLLLSDKGSVNGVYIGAKRISNTPVRLDSGQEIKIGKTRIKIFTARHVLQPTQPHNLLSSMLQFCDRPLAGIFICLLAALFLICENARVESASVDFWKKEVFGIGMGFFLFVSIAWAMIHILLIIKNKKFMPWPRIVSFISIATVIVATFLLLIHPYIDFYLLSPTSAFIFAATSCVIFGLLFEYSYTVVCELPARSRKYMLYSAIAIVMLVFISSIDMEFDSDPIFPGTIVTADLPLFSVQPLDAFIEQALPRAGKI